MHCNGVLPVLYQEDPNSIGGPYKEYREKGKMEDLM